MKYIYTLHNTILYTIFPFTCYYSYQHNYRAHLGVKHYMLLLRVRILHVLVRAGPIS